VIKDGLREWKRIENGKPMPALQGAVLESETEGGALLAITPTRVEAQHQISLTVCAHFHWKPLSFYVVDEIASHFEVHSFMTMMHHLETSEAPIPCELFSTAACVDCQRKRLAKVMVTDWPVIAPGIDMRICIRNRSKVDATFRGGFVIDYQPIRWDPCL
jgi:hypothetical protein